MPIVLTLNKARSPSARQSESRTLDRGSLSIGRGPANDWVLQDPSQHLSKAHCVIASTPGGYVLTDLSSNGVFVNGSGTRLAKDARVALADGDEFLLGDYVMRVNEVEALSARNVTESAAIPRRGTAPTPADDDPFGLADFLTPAQEKPALKDLKPLKPVAAQRFDPFGRDVDSRDDPFGDVALDPMRAAPPAARPFGEAMPAAPRPRDTFDAPAQRQADRFGYDDMFQGAAPAETWTGPSQPDNVDAAAQAMLPPKVLAMPSMDDWDDLLGDTPPGVIVPPAAVVRPDPVSSPVLVIPAPVSIPASALPAPAVPAIAEMPATGGISAAQLLAAFLDGAGVPRLDVKATDPEAYFRMVGELFGTMVESVRDVLMSRAATKGEFGVERTMLRSRDNNALKFSVTPADAVAALLQPGRPGYMPPARATKEAFDDIRSHQIAVMAGVQAALFHLLRTFDPAALEARLQKGSRIASLIPGAREARLWEAFRATYKEIARDADADFQQVFGREFSNAYNEQIRAAGGQS